MNKVVKHIAEKHEFALFFESLSSVIRAVSCGDDFFISDEKVLHRMKNVLRLAEGDGCVFFDQRINASCVIREFTGKKKVHCVINKKEDNRVLVPQVTFLLPLLKRDDYEQALYALAEVGVTTIQLIATAKGRGVWSGQKDRERSERIIIAAAEQSKNFVYPDLKDPISLLSMVERYASKEKAVKKIFFDPLGTPLRSVVDMVDNNGTNEYLLLIGPEGDLMHEEKEIVRTNDFTFCALTPTVLRASHAASLSAGLIRSLFT